MLAQLTPKQIDRLEAQRDSDEALARALTYAKQKRADERARVMAVELRGSTPVSVLISADFLPVAEDKSRTAYGPPKHRHRTARQYQAFGMSKTLPEWANEYGHHVETLRNRIKRGVQLEDALTMAPERGRGPRGKLYTFDGETLSLTEWSARTGIEKSTLATRLHKGWTIEEALTTPLLKLSAQKKRDRGEGRSTCEARGTGVGSLARESEELGFFQCPL
ncbi:MAG: hypothetical protein ABJF67_13390 [Aurantimonas coralicida]|uniref:hypothetical protein n=1 Tax=Nisaea sp. TaxID=2024842 RepID=UPI003265634C